MKEYLVEIELRETGSRMSTTINGDSLRPFQIAHNLWNYTTPWHAAQRLERIAKTWEVNGFHVIRTYGPVYYMETTGNRDNAIQILRDWEEA